MWFKKAKKRNKKFLDSKESALEEEKDQGRRNILESELLLNIIVIFLFVFSLIIILSILNQAGVLGKYLYQGGSFLLGGGYYFSPLIFLLAGWKLFKEKKMRIWNWLGFLLIFLSLTGILEFIQGAEGNVKYSGLGGYSGFWIGWALERVSGSIAALIILFGLFIISLLFLFNTTLEKIFSSSKEEMKRITGIAGSLKNRIQEKKEKKREEKEIEEEMARIQKEEKASSPKRLVSLTKPSYKAPPLNLLEDDQGRPESGNIRERAQIIEKTLKNFGIEVSMDKVSVGPTVTQYTLRPAQGVKLRQITTLHNDIALSLAAHPVRIEAPIPGKSLVGVEVPNKRAALVRLKGLLKSKAFKKSKSSFTIALGRDVAGDVFLADLEKMPHILIAGATGSGKSVCLNSIILTLLYQNAPKDLKLILIDPKRVEMSYYNGIAHLLTPPINEPKKTINALKWTVKEMERRYRLLAEKGRRDLHSYNAGNFEEHLPFIVVCIDELADLMAVAAGDVEGVIVRLSQMARAVGIHLIVATQRPSVNVITGLIKANITSRIAFNVASQVDSRTIIDERGAEKLLGNGDMLYRASDQAHPVRIQGALVTEKEIEKVTTYLKMQEDAEYQEEITQRILEEKSLSEEEGEIDDELYEEAKGLVVAAGKASASLLQRRLKIGYARAARLLDYLEEQGIVGPQDGSKPREILVKQTDEFSEPKYERKEDHSLPEAEERARSIEENNGNF